MTDLPPPHHDFLQGACLKLGSIIVLVTGNEWQAAVETLRPQADILLEGQLTLRYAIYYQELEDVLIPQLAVDDHQMQHQGQELFKFVLSRGLAYPRADVIGKRLSGEDDHVFMRQLDLARPLVTIAYASSGEQQTPARIALAVVLDKTSDNDDWQPIKDNHPSCRACWSSIDPATG